MSIVSHTAKLDPGVQDTGNRFVRCTYADHIGETVERIHTLSGALSPGDTDIYIVNNLYPEIEEEQSLNEVLSAIAETYQGISPEKVAQYQTQDSYDRRVLGRAMQLADVHAFNAAYPFFQNVESRGGANASQRATYLGITTVDYGLIEDRFNPMAAVQVMLAEQKSFTWDDFPEVFY